MYLLLCFSNLFESLRRYMTFFINFDFITLPTSMDIEQVGLLLLIIFCLNLKSIFYNYFSILHLIYYLTLLIYNKNHKYIVTFLKIYHLFLLIDYKIIFS